MVPFNLRGFTHVKASIWFYINYIFLRGPPLQMRVGVRVAKRINYRTGPSLYRNSETSAFLKKSPTKRRRRYFGSADP